MPRLAVLIVLLLLGIVTPASALDCTKAQTIEEKAICGDAALKAQDAALSAFYFDTLRSLKGPRHDLLVVDQRRWLEDDRLSNCEPATKPSVLVPCLATSLAARRRAIAICFADRKDDAAELAGQPITGADVCTAYFHPPCPKVAVTASARLANYPWLLKPLLAEAKSSSDGSGCGARDDPSEPTDQDESSTTVTILAERPNLVSVRIEDDSMATGAAHPLHGERIASYDTRTKTEIPVTALLPALKPKSDLLVTISKVANKGLEPSCCGDDTDHTFAGIGRDSDTPMPDGWAVAASGDLILSYDYSTLGRDFVATAKIPRNLVIDAVDPKYVGLFVKDPTAK